MPILCSGLVAVSQTSAFGSQATPSGSPTGYIWQQSIRQESTWQQCIGKQSIGKRPGFSNLLSTTSAMVGA